MSNHYIENTIYGNANTLKKEMKGFLNPGIILHQYNISSSQYADSLERHGVSTATHGIGIICYFILTLFMSIILIRRWKEMISFKRFFYMLLIITAILQILSQSVAIAHGIGSLIGLDEYITQLFFIIYYCGLMTTIVMCNYCQAMVSKVLYGIYFHKSQSWMRKSDENNSFNEGFRIFFKYYSIGMTLTWTIALIILVPSTLILSMVYYMDGVNKQIGQILGIWSIISVAIVGLVNSICSIVTGVLNFCIVILLSRYLLHQSNPIPVPRKKACKKLVLLTFGQFYMAIINTLSIMLGAIGILYPYLFIITGVIHRCVFILFTICVSFSFGPMDYFHVEFKLENNKLTANLEPSIPSIEANNTFNNKDKTSNTLNYQEKQSNNSFRIDSKAFRQVIESSTRETNKIQSPFTLMVDNTPKTSINNESVEMNYKEEQMADNNFFVEIS